MTVPANSLVFAIDDDPSVRKALTRMLRVAGYQSEIFESASDFLKREQHTGATCVIVDVRMPGIGGMDLQESLIQHGREEQLVFITGHGDIATCAQAMKAGAVDFLSKPIRSDELLQCVERALVRSGEQRRQSAERHKVEQLVGLLTSREYQVMQCVIKGMLNKQIAGELGTAEKTVKVHRGRMMRKLHVTSVVQLVRLIEGTSITLHPGYETKVS